MKFWHKTFLATLVLFLIAFDIGIFMIADISYNNSIESEKTQDLGEHFFISRSLSRDMETILERDGDTSFALQRLFESYGNYYSKQGVFLTILHEGEEQYSNFGLAIGESPEFTPAANQRSVRLESNNDTLKIFISGELGEPLEEYTVVYAKDLAGITESQKRLTNSLLAASVVISAALAVALYYLLHRLSRPIRSLTATTKRIADGQHGVRVPVDGTDEFAQLASSFNHMAKEVETQIQKLEKSAQQKQQFVDNLAHELRTPLTSISGYADYIQRAAINEDDKIVATDYIINESNRLKEVAYKLMDMAVLRESGITKQEVDIENLIEKATATAVVNADSKGVSLRKNVKNIAIEGDEVLLRSMLINLIDNAVKACSKGGVVLVRTYYDAAGYPCISVDDTGSGLTEEQLEQVIQPFYRVDKARSRGEGGAGLGLSLVQQIAESHDATLSYISEVDKGTTVTVCFMQGKKGEGGQDAPRIDFTDITLDD